MFKFKKYNCVKREIIIDNKLISELYLLLGSL